MCVATDRWHILMFPLSQEKTNAYTKNIYIYRNSAGHNFKEATVEIVTRIWLAKAMMSAWIGFDWRRLKPCKPTSMETSSEPESSSPTKFMYICCSSWLTIFGSASCVYFSKCSNSGKDLKALNFIAASYHLSVLM